MLVSSETQDTPHETVAYRQLEPYDAIAKRLEWAKKLADFEALNQHIILGEE